MKKKRNIWTRFLAWRMRKKNNQNFFFLLSIGIGIGAGFLALFLKSVVFYMHGFFLSDWALSLNRFSLLLLPLLGIVLTVILKRWMLRDGIRHNVTSILHAISSRKSMMKSHKIVSSVIGAVFTAGLGGSAGLESPIISSGASFGSNIGKWLRMSYKEVTLLLACGSSAAISAIFNTPIAGIVFAIEVLMIDLTRFSLIPLLLSSVTGTIITYIFYGEGILFQFSIVDAFDTGHIPYYIFLGIISALVCIYFTRSFLFIEKISKRIKQPLLRAVSGGLILGVLLLVFPQLYGEGYFSITPLLNHDLEGLLGGSFLHPLCSEHMWIFVLFMLALIFLKVIATSVTISAGGIGGIFAPSVFTGAFVGYLFAFSVNMISGEHILSESNFALVGMAGALSGVLHAPLTGLFLIVEITKGYHLIVPLMICVTVAFIIVKAIEPNSVFTMQLAKRGELITHHKDRAVLTFMKLERVIERNLRTVHIDASLGELVKVISQSNRNIFPVIDDDENLHGIVYVEDIRDIMFEQEQYEKTYVRNLMRIPPERIQVDDKMQVVMQKFQKTDAWNLPVLDGEKYEGIISKSSLFSAYRKQLMNITDE